MVEIYLVDHKGKTLQRIGMSDYRQRKVYVDWMQSRYMTPAQLRRVGYEIL